MTTDVTPRRGCLPGCHGQHYLPARRDGYVCEVPVGATSAVYCAAESGGAGLLVAVTRFADREGSEPPDVQLVPIVGGVAEDPFELVPDAARQLAVQLIHAANVAGYSGAGLPGDGGWLRERLNDALSAQVWPEWREAAVDAVLPVVEEYVQRRIQGLTR